MPTSSPVGMCTPAARGGQVVKPRNAGTKRDSGGRQPPPQHAALKATLGGLPAAAAADCGGTRTKVDVAEGAASNLAPQPVLVAHSQLAGHGVAGRDSERRLRPRRSRFSQCVTSAVPISCVRATAQQRRRLLYARPRHAGSERGAAPGVPSFFVRPTHVGGRLRRNCSARRTTTPRLVCACRCSAAWRPCRCRARPRCAAASRAVRSLHAQLAQQRRGRRAARAA